MKKISAFILTVLIFVAGACSSDSGANTIFAPIAGALGLGTTNNAFSNDLNDPVSLPGDVAVTQPPQANAGSAPLRGIIALERARLGRASRVDADVSVLTSGASHRELVLHRFARMEANRIARADSIRLHKRASILGTAEYNDIKLGRRASVADQVTPLGDLPLLPPFLTGTPGTQRIDHGDSPLAAGNYGKLKLKKKKTLVLTGGIYHFTDVRLSRRSSLICESTCVLLVKNRLRAGRRVQLSAMSGKSSDLIIYVEGESHPHASVRLHKHTNTTADIYAPNGKVRVGRHANYTGNLIGKRVVIARGTRVVSGAEVPRRVAKLFKAGEAGVLEIPGEIRLEVPACALSEDTVISIAEKPVTDAPPLPVGNIVSASAYDLQPDGLEFDCDVALTQKYDADLVSDAGLDEDDLRLLIASGSTPFLPVPTIVEAAEDQVRGTIRHFSISLIGGVPGGTQATDLEFDGDIVALVYWGQPLQIINVQDKANPVLLPNPAGTPIPTSVEVAGNYVYVAGGFGQLFTIDVSGAVPVIVAQTANSTWTAMDMRVDGNYLYAASAAGSLRVADISNPAAPVIIPGAERALPGFVRAVDVSGSYAFVAHETSVPCPPCGLTVFDISDPLNPVQTTTTTLGLTGSTRLVNIKAEGNRVYLNARIFEFTAPGTLSIVGNGPGRYYEAVGDTLFTDVSGTFTVYDAADPAALNVLETFPTTFAGALRVDSNYAYVGTFTGLEILDLGDLTAGPSCTFLPATWVMTSGAQTITYNCTSNGLTYTCADDAGTLPTVEYVYPSATAAKLGLIDAPLVANFPGGGFRGSAIRLPSLGFSIDYTLDGMNRLATVMEASSGTNSTFGNYDANGYPQTLTGAITSGTYTYTYGAGSTPSQIQAVVNGANSTLNYSGRFMTAWNINDGFTTGTASRSGSVLVCEPPPPIIPGTGTPEHIDISAGRGFAALPHAVVDPTNQKLLVVAVDGDNGDKPGLWRCDLDGQNCVHRDISAGQGNSSGRDPQIVLDSANAKILVVTRNGRNGFRPSLFRCDLDGTNCVHTDISAGQPANSAGWVGINELSVTAALDTVNNKLLVVTHNRANEGRPSLFRCDPDGSGCTHTDLSGGNPSGLYFDSGSHPNLLLDVANSKMIVVTRSGGNQRRPTMYRCDLDGSNCVLRDLSAGRPANSAIVISAAIDTVNSRLLVFTNDGSNGNRLSLFRCGLDGFGCFYRDLSQGQGPNSANNVDGTVDLVNQKLLVVTKNNDDLGKPYLTRCDLDGTGCTVTDMSAGQGVDSGTRPFTLLDTITSKLLTITTNFGNNGKLGLFRL